MTQRKRTRKIKKPVLPTKLLFAGLILIVALIYIWITGRLYANNSKITVVVGGKDAVYISTFDKEAGTITNLQVPINTQVNVARELGTWKIESVWKLGENEKLGGLLLSETVLKNFKIPVNAWADSAFYGISEGGLGQLIKGILPYKSSLGMGDKIKLALFSLSVSPRKRTNINLANLSFLRKTKLVGGETGYLISENFPQSLYYIFSDSQINKVNLRIEIQNYSEVRSGGDLVAQALEVFGGKVAAITKHDSQDFFCEVSGRQKEIIGKIAQIFGCKTSTKKETDNFDAVVKVGSAFAKRY